ncbi:membrane protein [Spirochaetia bacterium]|nr:membrane protein [Spirochaetia bacterium]
MKNTSNNKRIFCGRNGLRCQMHITEWLKSAGIAVLVLCLLGIVLLSGCERLGIGNKAGANGTEAAAPVVPVFAVNTSNAAQGQIRDYLALSGDIIAGSTVDAYTDVAIGKVNRLYVAVGDRVSRGDPVVAIDPSRPGMTYVASVVRAPISGTIVALPAQLGMTVGQSVPLARISSSSALEIRLYVAERFISRINLNQPCEITLDAYPGEIFRGAIREISPTVDPSSRTMEVRVNVDNTGSRLKTGMFAKVRIITEQKENIVKIPAGALVRRFGENYVFAVANDPNNPGVAVARQKTITPGIEIDGVLEVEQGLSPNEEIIIKGQTLLEDGSHINIIDRIAPLGAAINTSGAN